MPSSRGRRAQQQVGAASPCSHVLESCLDQARRAGWDEARQAPPGSGQQGEGETRLPGRPAHARSYQRHASPREKHPVQQRACAAPGMQHLLQDYCKTCPACNPSSSCFAPALTAGRLAGIRAASCDTRARRRLRCLRLTPEPTHTSWFNLHSSAHGARWEAGGCWVPQPDVQSPAVRHAAGRAARRGSQLPLPLCLSPAGCHRPASSCLHGDAWGKPNQPASRQDQFHPNQPHQILERLFFHSRSTPGNV